MNNTSGQKLAVTPYEISKQPAQSELESRLTELAEVIHLSAKADEELADKLRRVTADVPRGAGSICNEEDRNNSEVTRVLDSYISQLRVQITDKQVLLANLVV